MNPTDATPARTPDTMPTAAGRTLTVSSIGPDTTGQPRDRVLLGTIPAHGESERILFALTADEARLLAGLLLRHAEAADRPEGRR